MKRTINQKTLVAIAIILIISAVGIVALTNTDRIAVQLAPKKQAATSRSENAKKADELFWQTFHGGKYEKIQATLDVLTAAYLETPNDATTAAHIAWLHNWRIAERSRMNSVPATITDDTMLARRYFREAVKLDPSDARTLGFLGGHIVAEGTIHKDEELTREGYYILLDAIKAWPEFNLFTAGFVMSRLPADSPRFKEGLEWQWRALDVCIDGKIDRVNPDYFKYRSLETKEGPKRACWNSWIAPHNLEGFFLNMGICSSSPATGKLRKRSMRTQSGTKEYPSWKYQAVLDDRIKQAQANVALFNSSGNAPNETPGTRIMINSEFSCMACHLE